MMSGGDVARVSEASLIKGGETVSLYVNLNCPTCDVRRLTNNLRLPGIRKFKNVKMKKFSNFPSF